MLDPNDKKLPSYVSHSKYDSVYIILDDSCIRDNHLLVDT